MVSQKLGEVRSRNSAGDALFLNQHESGSFPRSSSTSGSARFGMKPHLSVDFEADQAVMEANRRTLRRLVAARQLHRRAARSISFGADFLDGWGASVPQQLDFADARAKFATAPRVVYIGPRRSLTGLNADQWIACKPGSELAIAQALLGAVGAGARPSPRPPRRAAWTPACSARWPGNSRRPSRVSCSPVSAPTTPSTSR